MIEARRLLVIGGARSGKSAFALRAAEAVPATERVFVATAQAFDDEMGERIDRHRLDRDPSWATVEAPFDLADAISVQARPGRVVLADCLTLWLSNVMLADGDALAETRHLVATLDTVEGPVVLVTNEVGQGIVPATALGRAFRDAQGRLNQAVAAACDAVVLVAAGLPVVLKPAPAPAIRLL